jgi:hypothetical protein
MKTDISTARNILKGTRPQLLSRAHVIATGVGYKVTRGKKTPDLSVICSVVKKLPDIQLSKKDRIPLTIDGIPTDVVETGTIYALQSHTARYRPAPGGVSIGHRDITAGTLGCLVKKNGQTFILSNNHVLANSNEGQIGDPILQPGPYDGGKFPNDHIANLSEFISISYTDSSSGCPLAGGVAGFLNGIAGILGSDTRLKAVSTHALGNLVDAAIARPLNDQDVKNEILEIGAINGLTQGELGMAIKKSGRTTALTSGEIQQVDVTVNVQYGEGRIALFTDQLLAGAMSQGGDSGSAVLENNNKLVGLLFAGSDTTTIINRIENVFSALGLSL